MEANKTNESVQTKVCKICGRALPLSEFHKCRSGKFGVHSYCKECTKKIKAEKRLMEQKHLTEGCNPKLSEFTPRELIEELQIRGYKGDLYFEEIIVHKVKL